MLSVPEGLRIGASGLAARQLERGDRGSVPASRTFPEIFECEASGRVSDGALRGCFLWKLRTGLTAGPKNLTIIELVEALHETDHDEW